LSQAKEIVSREIIIYIYHIITHNPLKLFKFYLYTKMFMNEG